MFEIDPYKPTKNRRRNIGYRVRDDAQPVQGPWTQPLGTLGSRTPAILGEYVTDERRGVDFGYALAPYDAELFVPVYAVQNGEIAMALETTTGYSISIDHGNWTYSTHYAHLSKMFVTPCAPRLKRRQYVRAGEVIGYAAKSPVHVRFELWQWTDAKGYVAIDPTPQLAQWRAVPMPSGLRGPTAPATNQEAA